MNKSKAYLLGSALAICLLIAGWWWQSPQNSDLHSSGGTGDFATLMIQPPEPMLRNTDPANSLGLVQETLSEALTPAKLFDRLKEFKHLNSKVLFTAEEKSELQSRMSDDALIRKAFMALIESNNDLEGLAHNQMLRMMSLDFLEAGMRWKENPARVQVEESLRHALLYDNLSNISDLEIRKSFAGDKVEAYSILKEHSPDSLAMLNDIPENGRIRKLIQYAERLTQDL